MLQPAGARRLLCTSQGRLIVTLWSPWSADFRDEVFSGLSCHVLLCFDLSVIPEGDALIRRLKLSLVWPHARYLGCPCCPAAAHLRVGMSPQLGHRCKLGTCDGWRHP